MSYVSRELRDLARVVLVLVALARPAAAQDCEHFTGATKFNVGFGSAAIAARESSARGVELVVAVGADLRTIDHHANGYFTIGRTYSAGAFLNSVVLADFNGDGFVDLAAGGGSADIVSVRLADPVSGILNDHSVDYTLDMPRALVAADFDGDSDLDLAVANGRNNSVSILRNDGTGAFAMTTPYDVGLAPSSLATGDIDADGDSDLVVGNSGSKGVSVLRNDGAGRFTVTGHTIDHNAGGVAAGDFDGDGDADIAVAESAPAQVVILTSNRDGSFQRAGEYAVGDTPGPMTAADLDGDGLTDPAVVNRGANSFTLLFAEGDGTFHRVTHYATGEYPSSLVAADINEDGVIDLAVPSQRNTDVRFFFGVGGGVFTSHHAVLATDVITADFNDDGHLDFAAADGDVLVVLGRGDGSFEPGISLAAAGEINYLASGDFNEDAILDIVGASLEGIYVFLGSGDGAFGEPAFFDEPGNVRSIAVQDFNRDGKTDIRPHRASRKRRRSLTGEAVENLHVHSAPRPVSARSC